MMRGEDRAAAAGGNPGRFDGYHSVQKQYQREKFTDDCVNDKRGKVSFRLAEEEERVQKARISDRILLLAHTLLG